MRTLEGKLVAEGLKIGIVAARFNEFIVNKLVSGAEDACVRHGVNDDDITLAWVPGAFETRRPASLPPCCPSACRASSSIMTKSSTSPTSSRMWCWTTSCPAISTPRPASCTLPPTFPAWCSSCA